MNLFIVVICLQNVSLMCGITSCYHRYFCSSKLWFAYRMYLWCVESQVIRHIISIATSCDLLTECIFDVWNHKCMWILLIRLLVVICLQNVSLMCGITSLFENMIVHRVLWFAYRMYLWCVESQDMAQAYRCMQSCDLLTECIFDVWNHKLC